MTDLLAQMIADYAFFVVCKFCGHRKSAFLIFRDNNMLEKQGNPRMEDVQKVLHRLKCDKCGAKNIELETKTTKSDVKYVATTESAERVFHRSTCGWMRHVPLENEITFASREAAIKRGYAPCKSCRP